ncbi:MAG: FecR domain-containing protein [Pseudomonadaceae bacterium]|nr:FecR domain-containing protein [Pseudomonadaceae bacterium]
MSDSRHTDNEQAADAELEQILNAAGPRPQPPQQVSQRAYDSLKSEWSSLVAEKKQRRRRRLLSVAASIGVLVGSVWMFNVQQQVPTWEVAVTSGSFELNSTRYDAPQEMTLAEGDYLYSQEPVRFERTDGADLRLGYATALSIANGTQVNLQQGSVYIDTKGTTDFLVRTPIADVRDIGTRFMVSLESSTLQVAVREGAAEVTSEFGAQIAKVDGAKAQVVTVDNTGQTLQLESLADSRWEWIHAASAGYQSRSLTALVNQIGHDLGKTVRFADHGVEVSVANEQVDGDLRNMSPRQALEIITRSTGLVWREAQEEIILDFQR